MNSTLNFHFKWKAYLFCLLIFINICWVWSTSFHFLISQTHCGWNTYNLYMCGNKIVGVDGEIHKHSYVKSTVQQKLLFIKSTHEFSVEILKVHLLFILESDSKKPVQETKGSLCLSERLSFLSVFQLLITLTANMDIDPCIPGIGVV